MNQNIDLKTKHKSKLTGILKVNKSINKIGNRINLRDYLHFPEDEITQNGQVLFLLFYFSFGFNN